MGILCGQFQFTPTPLIKKIVLYTTLLCTLSFSSEYAQADVTACSKEEAQAIEAVAATIKSWTTLYQQYNRYSACDDGAIAEGFSNSVTSLLTEQWQDLHLLQEKSIESSSFKNFAIRHIDETVPIERLKIIIKNTHDHCPSTLQDICQDIANAANKALSSYEE